MTPPIPFCIRTLERVRQIDPAIGVPPEGKNDITYGLTGGAELPDLGETIAVTGVPGHWTTRLPDAHIGRAARVVRCARLAAGPSTRALTPWLLSDRPARSSRRRIRRSVATTVDAGSRLRAGMGASTMVRNALFCVDVLCP